MKFDYVRYDGTPATCDLGIHRREGGPSRAAGARGGLEVNAVANGAIHGVVQGVEREAVPLGALPWSLIPIERVSYSGKKDIDGYSTSSRHPDYDLCARPSIRRPDRWQINGNVWLPTMDWGHWLLRLLGRGMPRTTIYQMFIGETFPEEREAVQAAESWLGRVLRGEADQAEVLVFTL